MITGYSCFPVMYVKVVGLISNPKTFKIIKNMLIVENLESRERHCVNSVNNNGGKVT